jgi:hypothetical protein
MSSIVVRPACFGYYGVLGCENFACKDGIAASTYKAVSLVLLGEKPSYVRFSGELIASEANKLLCAAEYCIITLLHTERRKCQQPDRSTNRFCWLDICVGLPDEGAASRIAAATI